MNPAHGAPPTRRRRCATVAVAVALLAGLTAPSLLAASGDRLAEGAEPLGEPPAQTTEDATDAIPAEPEVAQPVEAAPPVTESAPPPQPQSPGEAAAGGPEGGERAASERSGKPRGSRERRGARAAQSASGAVDIRNFAYAPREITVSAGETVQWTNRDREPHDAEAFDGSFKTSVLDQGESDSVTFRNAGTFRYFCSIHPPSQFPDFTGTVRVLGSAGEASGGDSVDPTGGATSGGGGEAGEGAATASRGAVAGRDGALPATGLTLIPLVAVGIVLLSTGGFLRRLRSAG